MAFRLDWGNSPIPASHSADQIANFDATTAFLHRAAVQSNDTRWPQRTFVPRFVKTPSTGLSRIL